MDNYELALYTHLDEYVALLKGPVDFAGQAFGTTLKRTNGEEELNFSFPLRFFDYETEQLVDNPLWDYIVNGVKIRLIKNRNKTNEEVYDFVVKNYEEYRDNSTITMAVSCKAYSMHELDKKGFTITVDNDILISEDYNGIYSINYWLERFIPYTQNAYSLTNTAGWQYVIDTPDGKIYEKHNITNYEKIGEVWEPVEGPAEEKSRLLSFEESNLFNIFQELAEKFQVWISFQYEYDNNYKTTARKIIIKNEVESDSPYGITYGVNITNIKRINTGEDIITKLYVKDINDEFDNFDGIMTIKDAPQNFMKENFLYNFDYAKEKGLISSQQYADFLVMQNLVREKNLQYEPLSLKLINTQTKYDKTLSELTFIDYQISAAEDILGNLVAELAIYPVGLQTQEDWNCPVQTKEGYFYADISSRKGIVFNTITVQNFARTTWVTGFEAEYDPKDPTCVIGLKFLTNPDSVTNKIKVSFDYDPLNYIKKLIVNQNANIESLRAKKTNISATALLLENTINSLNNSISTILTDKQTLIDNFEKSVYFAIQEGNWNDTDYDIRRETVEVNNQVISNVITTTSGYSLLSDLNNIDFNSIEVWKTDYSYKYYRYSDFTLEYGTNSSNTKALLISPIATGAFYNNKLVESGKDTRFVATTALIIKYLTLAGVAKTVTVNRSSTLKKYERSFIIPTRELLSSTLKIYPTTTSEELAINTDYTMEVLDTNVKILLNATQNAQYLTTYYKVSYDKNITTKFYYNDAEDIMLKAAYPKVSYEISVLDLSSLPGYELYKPVLGQKVPITDTDLRLNRVYGFISEINEDLDNPQNTSVTISNYQTKFEDLFQRIVTATEQFTSNGERYERVAAILTPKNTLDSDVLQNSFLENYITLSSGTDNSVTFGKDGITLMDTSSTRAVPGIVKIIGDGIFLSNSLGSTGARKWSSAITPDGINASQITAGQLDVKKIIIWDGTQPRFLWNGDGINAYSIGNQGQTLFSDFVRFNSDGLLFQRNLGTTEIPKIITELSLTWTGLALSSQEDSLKLTSTYGLQVFDGEEVERIQIGRLYNGAVPTNNYGMRLKDSSGIITLETDTSGKLWLRDSLSLGSSTSTVGLYGGGSVPSEIAIWAGSAIKETGKFRVTYGGDLYANNATLVGGIFSGALSAATGTFTGELVAASGSFSGEIIATSGRFTDVVYVGADSDTTGISGLESLDNSPVIRFWAGSELDDLSNAEFRLYSDGSIIANSATIKGIIKAQSGEINGALLIAGGVSGIDGTIGEIPLWINYLGGTKIIDIAGVQTTVPDRTDSIFYLDDSGSIYSKSLYLTKEAKVSGFIKVGNDDLGIYGGDDLIDPLNNQQIRFWVNPNLSVFDSAFRIYNDGTVFAKTMNLTDNLIAHDAQLSGTIFMDNMILNGYDNNDIAFIGSNIYASGALGWRINNNGSADFNNVNIRGTLKSVVFEYNEISAVGGDLYVSPSIITPIDIPVTITSGTAADYLCSFSIDIPQEVDEVALWPTGTEFKFNGILFNNLNQYKIKEVFNSSFQLVSFVGGIAKFNISFEFDNTELNPLDSFMLLPGSTIINLGTFGNKKGIHLSAQESNGPYIDLFGQSATVTRLGNLSGVFDSENSFGTLGGFGLYSDNVYLKGKLYLPNAGLTDEEVVYDISSGIYSGGISSEVRIWAGAPANQKHKAPFVVTQDGSLYASKGVFSGVVEATNSTFSGVISATGIVIDGAPYSDTKDEFYVAYDNFDIEGNLIVSDDNLILKINKNGLSIFEGGFQVYSDDAISNLNIPYGKATAEPYFPYIAAIDTGKRLSAFNGHFIEFSKENDVPQYHNTIVEGASIKFGYSNNLLVDTFKNMETSAFNDDSWAQIQLLNPNPYSNHSLLLSVQRVGSNYGNIIFNNYLNNEYSTFNNSIKVGVNTSSPNAELDVVGAIATDREFDIGDVKMIKVGTINTPSYGYDLII